MWIFFYADELAADFLRFYQIMLEPEDDWCGIEVIPSGPRFFKLATKVLSYEGSTIIKVRNDIEGSEAPTQQFSQSQSLNDLQTKQQTGTYTTKSGIELPIREAKFAPVAVDATPEEIARLNSWNHS